MDVQLTPINEVLEKNLKVLMKLFNEEMKKEFKNIEKDVENLENVIKYSSME